MLKDITLGQYYPADSVLHRLDPRVKLLGTVLFIVCCFLYKGTISLILLTVLLLLFIGISKVPPKKMIRGVRALWPLILIMAFFNLFFTDGDILYWHAAFLKISDAGIHNAVVYTIRLVYLIIGSSVMTLTTTPNKLTDGMEEGLKVFNRIGVPVHEIAMMMSIALRFIPLLGEEAEKIKKAQLARGASFDEGGVIQRAKGMLPVLIPLFVSAFGRANDLALAMEARCYRGGEGRTKLHPLVFERRDYIGLVLIFVMTAVFIVLRPLDFALPF